MTEKDHVAIDSDISIPEGTEQIFENQHIQLGATVEVSGSLIIRNCTIEQSNSGGNGKGRSKQTPWYIYVQSNGKLEMDGCEVIHPSTNFLHGCNMVIKNTSFLFAVHSDAAIFTMGKVKFEECSFVEEPSETGNTPTRDLISCNDDIFDNCTFQNITGKISADTIIGCTFSGCNRIFCLRQIRSSTFEACNQVCIVSVSFGVSGLATDCEFIRVGEVISNKGDMENCKFRDLSNDSEGECIISLTNGKITQCSFEDIVLSNDSYLIIGDGNVLIKDCEFLNCQTDREDSQLFYIKQKKSIAKGLFKGALKLAGSAALAATGAAATLAREAGSATGIDVLTDVAGMAQDASFEKIRDMWTPDEKKDDAYYEAQAKRSERRAVDAERRGSQFRKQYEKEKAKYEDDD